MSANSKHKSLAPTSSEGLELRQDVDIVGEPCGRTVSSFAPVPYEAHACRFNFLNSSTFNIPFTTAKDTIDAIYLVVPMTISDTIAEPVNAFIDFARKKGVKRFVLLSSIVYPPPTRICGAVHQHLMDCGGGVEYVIIQPTWYFENFSRNHVPTVKDKGIIVSASEDGPARWLSTDDVGAAAVRALTDKSLKNTEHILLGLELLTYDDIAKILSEVTGKQITHARVSLDEYKVALEAYGITGYRTQLVLELHEEMARGDENRLDNGEVLRLTGKQPITFREWAEKNKAVWQ